MDVAIAGLQGIGKPYSVALLDFDAGATKAHCRCNDGVDGSPRAFVREIVGVFSPVAVELCCH